MPIPVTPRFKRLLETANPEQKKALGTSSVQSDSDSRDYREEKFKSMPRAMKRIDAGYQDTTDMTPAEKEKYAFENTLSDFRARFRNDEQATHVLDLLEKQYYNSMLAPDKKPYSYYYDNPEDTRRVGVIQPVAQPAPDPFDKETNAAESLMGLSDILPDAVYQVTGSDLAAFASGFLSPSQWLKKGAKGVSNIMDSTTFKKFRPDFTDSILKNEQGELIPLYHGTSKDKDFKQFKKSTRGTWLSTDPKEASMYAKDNDSMSSAYNPMTRKYEIKNTASRVIPVYANIKNPYKLNEAELAEYKITENYSAFQKKITSKAEREGYDAIDWGSGTYSIIDPKNIESAISPKQITFPVKR